MSSLLPSPHSFLSHIFHTLETLKIDVSELELDHVCYRVETWERYEELKVILDLIVKLEDKGSLGIRTFYSIGKESEYIYNHGNSKL